MKFLLDTCFVSELIKPKPNSKVIDWLEHQDHLNLWISVLTLGEIQKGICKLPQGKKKQELLIWMNQELVKRFFDRTVDITPEICIQWGTTIALMEDLGKPISVIDGLLAASALVHDLWIITRNSRDFEGTGAKWLNPWK